MDLAELLTAAEGKSVSLSSIIILMIGAGMAWKYFRGFSKQPAKPQVQLSPEAWSEVKNKVESHETRISRVEGYLNMRVDQGRHNMPGGDHAQ